MTQDLEMEDLQMRIRRQGGEGSTILDEELAEDRREIPHPGGGVVGLRPPAAKHFVKMLPEMFSGL